LKGQRADHRADLYAVGVLMFQLLTGKKPFVGKDSQELVASILAGRREKVRALAPECPRVLEKIVDRCLERDLEARYSRAADLRKDLEMQLNGVSSGNPSARLVGFLFTRGYAKPDDLATLDVGELAIAEPSIDISMVVQAPVGDSIEIDLDSDADETSSDETEEPRRARRWLRAVGATLVLLLALGGVTYALAPVETEAALRQAVERAAALGR
jgi:serine/threonine protein kinase